jgi:hypothetical protein
MEALSFTRMDEQHIHQNIGLTLYNADSENDQKTTSIELFVESDDGKYDLDYINLARDIDLLYPDCRAINALTAVLIVLKKYHTNNCLFLQPSPWAQITIELNLSSIKYAINMFYEH